MNLSQQPAAQGEYDVDVIQMSDFRLPGGTTSSVAEEVRAQSAVGITTAMVHVAGSVTNYPNAWSAHIRTVLGLPHVRLATVQTPLRARVLIIRHPTVLQSTRMPLTAIQADSVVIVANHAAVDGAGTWHYDVAAADARARRVFGTEPIWAPIGPVVRGAIKKQKSGVPLREKDWLNVFALDEVPTERTGWVGEKPVIGRHSRPQLGKWPDRGKDILAAYPQDGSYEVKILGGAQVAEKLLGYVPPRWEVIPFGGENPAEFLRRIDFWVYVHHPDLKEAFGRAAMEALAAGCVAIMPPYLKELFGDAALYAKPSGVRALLDEYAADTEKFLAQSRRAQEFARSFSPEMHIKRLEDLGVEVPHDQQAQTQVAPAEYDDAEQPSPAQRIMAVTETHPQALACIPTVEPSPAPGAAQTAWVVTGDAPARSAVPLSSLYVPSVARMNMYQREGAAWLSAQMQRIADHVAPDELVYLGEAPPQGLLEFLKGSAVKKTWLRVHDEHNSAVSAESVAAMSAFHRVVDSQSAEASSLRDQWGWK